MPSTQEFNRATARLSTKTLPSGGICDDGRRDFTRRTTALDSGCPGLISRDASWASGTTQCPRLPTVVARAAVHSSAPGCPLPPRASARGGPELVEGPDPDTVCFRINPSDAIELSRLWQLPQFVDRYPSAARACGDDAAMRGGVSISAGRF